MYPKPNMELRNFIKTSGVPNYAIADFLHWGISKYYRILQMRNLPDAVKKEIMQAVDVLRGDVDGK